MKAVLINKPKFKISYFVSMLVLSVTLSACGSFGTQYPEHYGRVLSEINDKPITQTIVVALWKGTDTSGDRHKQICYHVETTVSDKSGHFTIPTWHEPGRYNDLVDKHIYVQAFHSQYKTSELTPERLSNRNYIYYLAKPMDIDDPDQVRQDRQKYLLQLIKNTSCDMDGNSRLNLQPMYQAIYKEARDNMKTEKDRRLVQKLNAWLAYVSPRDR